MDILASRELEVDLKAWRPEAKVRLIAPGAVTVGHIADELARFCNLPDQTGLSQRVIYSLATPADVEEPIDHDAIVEDQKDGSADRSDGSSTFSLDRESLVAELAATTTTLTLVSSVESLVDQMVDNVTEKVTTKVDEVEAEIRAKIDNEIDHWLEKGRSLVVGSFDDAMDQIRSRLTTEIAEIIPQGRRSIMTQFRGSRTVRQFMTTQARPAYDGAVRAGLAMARRSASVVVRWLGSAAATLGGGGVAGAGAVLVTGTAAGASSGASSGAGAGAAAGLLVAGVTVAAAAAIGPSPIKWFVNPASADEAASVDLPDVGGGNDLMLDLQGKNILIRDEDGDQPMWKPLAWPGAGGGGGSGDHEHEVDHEHDFDHEHDEAGSAAAHHHDDSYTGFGHDHRTSFASGFDLPAADNDADFFVNRCTGVLYGNDSDRGWRPLVELSLIDAAALTDRCDPHTIERGQTLWGLVVEACGRASRAEVAREVNRTWLANLGVIGSEPDALPVGAAVVVKCE